jgi:Arc/MetJ-type ribon-helix-helix transcriptional regulator
MANNMESMPKQKVTITVEKTLIEWIDEQVKKYRFRNTSHAFEYAVAELIRLEKEKKE